MGQRIYILCLDYKFNVVGIYANIRQVRKNVILLNEHENKVLLFELCVNESPSIDCGRDVTFMLQPDMVKNVRPPSNFVATHLVKKK